LEKPTKPFAVFTKQFAVAHGLNLALGNGAHWEYSRTHDPAQSVELRRKQAIADGPFCSEEDAAVGKTDCTPMLKLVPFHRVTGTFSALAAANKTGKKRPLTGGQSRLILVELVVQRFQRNREFGGSLWLVAIVAVEYVVYVLHLDFP
jgi:hypothetical protein